MGMMIEEVELWARQNNCTIVTNNWREAVQDTINKYQKIKQIVNTWRHDITAGDYHCMAEVAEVIENGNDDN